MRGGYIGRSYYWFLSVLDAVLSALVIAPAVVVHWRGTWNLSDFYVVPQNLPFSLIASTLVGGLAQVLLSLYQEQMQRTFHPKNHRILYYVISRAYTYLYSVACVNMWRGEWKALDFYSGTDTIQVIVPTVVSLAVLVGLKTTRNLSSAPMAVALDSPTQYFQVPTMFKLTGTSDTSLYVLDCFFSVFVVGSLVVVVWRGAWCLLDVFLYPENEKYSSFVSLVIGYGVVLAVFIVQIPMESLCEKLSGIRRLMVADIYVVVAFIGIINLWRGIWNLQNIYFLPESPVLSCWISHLGGFAFLVLINCANSTLVRGVYLDGEDGGKCVSFPISYLRTIFKKNVSEKEAPHGKSEKKIEIRRASGEVEKGHEGNSENGKTGTQKGVDAKEVKS